MIFYYFIVFKLQIILLGKILLYIGLLFDHYISHQYKIEVFNLKMIINSQ